MAFWPCLCGFSESLCASPSFYRLRSPGLSLSLSVHPLATCVHEVSEVVPNGPRGTCDLHIDFPDCARLVSYNCHRADWLLVMLHYYYCAGGDDILCECRCDQVFIRQNNKPTSCTADQPRRGINIGRRVDVQSCCVLWGD